MGRNSKKESRLRAEVEILRARLKDKKGEERSFREFPVPPSKSKGTTSASAPEPLTRLSLVDVQSDLRRSFLLTVVAFSFIFLLKFAVIPHQTFITKVIEDLYQNSVPVIARVISK